MVYAKLQMYQKAICDFDEAIIWLKPNKREQRFKAHFNMGNCLRKIKEFELSIKMLKLASTSMPESAVAYNNLGLSYFENKEFE